MIELISVTNNNVKHYAAVGITAEELPVKELGTGSTCMMLDTGKKYIYFEGNESWYEDKSGGAKGGGGETGAGILLDPEMVNFIDYDGKVVEQWGLDSLQERTELPSCPDHAGLIAQGWNWTLEDIQDFGKPNVVGMLYVTDDGWTRFYLEISERREISVSIYVDKLMKMEIDWGDGVCETISFNVGKTLYHVYEDSGDFVLRMYANGEEYKTGFIRYYDPETKDGISNTMFGIVRKIESGVGIGFHANSFSYTNILETVTFTKDLTYIGAMTFSNSSIKAAVIPRGITGIPGSIFNEAKWLEVISLPRELLTIASKAFYRCQNLTFIVIPDRVTSIDSNVLSECSMLENAILSDEISSGGASLLYYCSKIKSVRLPDKMTLLPSQCLYYCSNLQKVIVGSHVETIGSNPFGLCKVLKKIYFLSANPPAGITGLFKDVASGFVIYVPKGSAEAYKTAEFWSDYADNIVEME